MTVKYNCVFGGGGVRGVAYVGAVSALEELNIELNSIAGSSVGAVFAVLYAIGYSAQEIKIFFMDFNFNMFKDLNMNIFDGDISISKGEIFLDWLKEKIEAKFYGNKYEKGTNPPVKFKDIDKDLQILTLDIKTNTPYIFSKKNTPEEEIALAVRISAGMPGLMKPVQLGEHTLIDGDLIKSRPAFKIFDDLNNPDTRLLEFRLEGTRDGSDIKNPSDYLNTVISTIWYLSTEHVYDLYHLNDRHDFVIIDAKEVIMFDFAIDKTQRENLIDKGYKTTKYYFTNTIIEKKKIILEIYKSMEFALKIMTKDVQVALTVINGILAHMREDINYADVSIWEEIEKLKKLIIQYIRNKLTIAQQKKSISEIEKQKEHIIQILNGRISDIENYINNICK